MKKWVLIVTPVFLTLAAIVVLLLSAIASSDGQRGIPNTSYQVFLLVIFAVLTAVFTVDWLFGQYFSRRFPKLFNPSPPPVQRTARYLAIFLAYLAGFVLLEQLITRYGGSASDAANYLTNDARNRTGGLQSLHMLALTQILLLVGLVHFFVRNFRFSYVFVVLAIGLCGILVPAFWVLWSWSSGLTELNTIAIEKSRQVAALERKFNTDNKKSTARQQLAATARLINAFKKDARAAFLRMPETDEHNTRLLDAGFHGYLKPGVNPVWLLNSFKERADLGLENVLDHLKDDHNHNSRFLLDVDNKTKSLVWQLQRYRALVKQSSKQSNEINLATSRYDQAKQDVETIGKRLFLPLWSVNLVAILLAILFGVMALHLAQIKPLQPRYLNRVARIGLGYSLMFYALAPFLIVALLVTGVMSFGVRISVSAGQLTTDVKHITSEIGYDIAAVKQFAEDEKALVEGIFSGLAKIENNIEQQFKHEVHAVKREIVTDYRLAKNTVTKIEKEAVDGVKNAVGSVVDKISGAFTFKLPLLPKIDLGIGKLLSKLIPDFDFGKTLKKLGTKLVTDLKQPFQSGLTRIKNLEKEIVDLAKKDLGQAEDLIRGQTLQIRMKVAELKGKLEVSKEVFRQDIYRLIDEMGDILHHILWLLTILLIVAGLFIIYILFGAALNFWLRATRAWELIFDTIDDQETAQ